MTTGGLELESQQANSQPGRPAGPLRVVCPTFWYPQSASDTQATYVHDINRHLVCRGHSVTVVTPGAKPSDEATKLVRETHLHMIADEDVMVNLGVASKMNGEIAFLEYLKNVGRARAEAWLTANFEAIGSRSTIDLDATLGGMEISQNR